MALPIQEMKVVGLKAVGAALGATDNFPFEDDYVSLENYIEDPNIEPWFLIAVYFSNGTRYYVITQDGTLFHYSHCSPTNLSEFVANIGGPGVHFSTRDESRTKEAIKRYVGHI